MTACAVAGACASPSSASANSGLNSIGVTPLVKFDDGGLGGAGVDQALQEALEMQAVDQHDIGLGHGDRVGRARLVDMGVAVRADDASSDVDAVAADIFGEIADDREAGDHFRAARPRRPARPNGG